MNTLHIERTRENAPKEVRAQGGVALSLWMTGAHQTDVLIVAGRMARQNALHAEVERLRQWIDTEGRNCPSNTTIDKLLASGQKTALEDS